MRAIPIVVVECFSTSSVATLSVTTSIVTVVERSSIVSAGWSSLTAASLWCTALVAFGPPSEVIIVAFRAIPIAILAVVLTIVSFKSRGPLFSTLESTVVGTSSAAVAAWLTASVAFLSESKVVVSAFGAIPIATVGTVVSVLVTPAVISFEASATIVAFKSTATVVSSSVLSIVASLAKVSLFAHFLCSNVDFDAHQGWDVEFSVQMGNVCERGTCAAEHSVNLTDVITSFEVDND